MSLPNSDHPVLPGFEEGAESTRDISQQRKVRAARKPQLDQEHLPPNLGQPVPVVVPDFANPRRPKTCLEVDFPLVPINALSQLEGNAGKPIYQMSKWWARRRSCVFRAMLLAAAMQAPFRKNRDGSPLLDAAGQPVPDETEAAKAVWDVYYANHQAAGNFKHLKVLDCFMGGGTTLVEGSRLGFQVAGVDLNPVAWFVVKNELACTDPDEVKEFFDRIEAEVKPLIQPFYVTDCPRGHRGKWFDVATGREEAVDPATLPPEERKKYRYEGPEVIYTFWAKHGPCAKPGCGHRTPVFRSPVIAEKKLGVKYIELTCKACKTTFHAELGSARMAPGAERVILDNEFPFTELSQPFAQRLHQYSEGPRKEQDARFAELVAMVDDDPGLKCPRCGVFAGQFVRDVLKMHTRATRRKDIDKKHLRILPPRNGTKPVYCYLLIHPDWLKGSPGSVDGMRLGGYADAPVEATARWYEERLKNLSLIEARGCIRLADDTSQLSVADAEPVATDASEDDEPEDRPAEETPGEGEASGQAENRKEYGLPRFLMLADGRQVDTRRGTVPKQSHFTCGACGQQQDLREALQATGHTGPVAVYAIQGYSPQANEEGHIYNGRFFAAPGKSDVARLIRAEQEWHSRRDTDLRDYWPREEIPHTYMTHHANFALPNQGYTHWWKMFNTRQLLVHSQLIRIAINGEETHKDVKEQILGAIQQYLRNQNMFCIWDISRDCMAPLLSNPNFAPKHRTIENSVVGPLGRGNWTGTAEGVKDGLTWAKSPWEPVLQEVREQIGDPRVSVGDPIGHGSDVRCMSSSELSVFCKKAFDLIITDPPFGDNIFYSDLANFFHAWLRLPLAREYPDLFQPLQTPNALEALAPRLLPEAEANAHYRVRLTACWCEAFRVLKDGGILAFTFHHSEDSQWAIVLESLFDAGFLLEQVYPIASDESKGEGGQFGAKGTEYDMIHVCRKRLEEPTRISWAKMRQWVKAELHRLRRLLEAYKARELSDADIRVILRGKALEFYSRHYGQVYTAEDETLSIEKALSAINQLLDEDTGGPGERPPSKVPPDGYQYLRLFSTRARLSRDEVGKSLRGTGVVQRELEQRGWVEEQNRMVLRVPIKERFDRARLRPRREMKTEIDQAHFLIGAALPGSGVHLEEELAKNTWFVRRSVEAVLDWYAKTAVEPENREAAVLAGNVLRRSIEQRRQEAKEEQGLLFDLDEDL